MSKAYENIVAKLASDVYKHNSVTRKQNRRNLAKKRDRLSKKISNGKVKQPRGDQAKIAKLDELIMRIDEYEHASPKAAPKSAPPKSASPKAAPKAASPPKHPAVVAALISDFFKTLATLNKKQVEDAVHYLSEVYYNEGISLISDENYDRLADLLKTKFGEVIGVGAEVVKHKVKLPYFMGSMDKIKPEKNNLASWKLRFPGQVCISDKLDGISALYVKEDGKRLLFTRGDGTIGQDIQHMLAHIQIGDIPSVERCVVRGELIVSKANYDRVKEGKRGARQMVSGLANQKTLTAERIAAMNLIEFVAYEVIVPEALKPSEQFTLMDSRSTFHTARWSSATDITIESLSELLTKRKDSANYEIDGIIVAHDVAYPRVAGRNPEHAFAFKMSFADQQATTEVLAVRWEASKDGYLKPTVQFEPVNIGGVVIQYATGFNAAFIHEKGIGPGAFVDIIRSGDVIPYITAVQSPSPAGPAMPEAKWHWNETHIDAVLDDASSDADVQKRILQYFAQTLDIGFCGEGNIAKVYDAGIHTIPQFVQMKEADIASQFAKKSAAKLVENVRAATAKATIVEWAVGSGIFGRGIGTKRLQPVFQMIASKKSTGAELTSAIAALSGWSRESAAGFVENLPRFEAFMDSLDIHPKLKTPPAAVATGKLKDIVVLFTGFHPKELEAEIVRNGGTVADAWSKKITVLVIKEAGVSNEKTKKAAAANIPIMTEEEFRGKYEL
jgi:NAD-dependent DNA ligase